MSDQLQVAWDKAARNLRVPQEQPQKQQTNSSPFVVKKTSRLPARIAAQKSKYLPLVMALEHVKLNDPQWTILLFPTYNKAEKHRNQMSSPIVKGILAPNEEWDYMLGKEPDPDGQYELYVRRVTKEEKTA